MWLGPVITHSWNSNRCVINALLICSQSKLLPCNLTALFRRMCATVLLPHRADILSVTRCTVPVLDQKAMAHLCIRLTQGLLSQPLSLCKACICGLNEVSPCLRQCGWVSEVCCRGISFSRSLPSAHRKQTATPVGDNHSWKMKSAVRQTNSINTYREMERSMDTDVRKQWFRWPSSIPRPCGVQDCYFSQNHYPWGTGTHFLLWNIALTKIKSKSISCDNWLMTISVSFLFF